MPLLHSGKLNFLMQGRHKGMEEICYWIFIGWGGGGLLSEGMCKC